MIVIRDIVKRYGEHTALGPVSLEFASGKTHVLLGPSGCGKSTLLRTVLRLVAPDEGAVLIDDEEVTAATADKVRRSAGYVIQDGGLFPHLTAMENASLMPKYLGWARQSTDDRVRETARLARFPEDALDRYPGELSGGQKQRVSLMRALVLDPDILLLDEPLGALDPLIRADLQQDLRAAFQELGKTVLFVTHDLGEAAALSDTVTLMREGQVVQRGRFSDLMDRPADPFVTRFVDAQRGAWEASRE